MCFPHEAKQTLDVGWLLPPAGSNYDSIRSSQGEGIGFLVLIDLQSMAH